MPEISQRFLFPLQEHALSQSLTQLPNKALSFNWLNKQGDVVSVNNSTEFKAISSAEMTVVESKEQKTKLVLFGQLIWRNLFEFQQLLLSSDILDFNTQVIAATNALDGAIQFNVPQAISAETQQQLVNWAEQHELELCFVDSNITLNEPGLLVMDMDSTAIQIECIDEIAKLAGVGEQVSKVTEQAMRGELDFAESLRARVATLKNAPISVIDEVANNLPLMPGLENLVAVLKQHNWKVVVASGGFTYMTEKLKQQLGLDETVANQLVMQNGQLTGEVQGRIVDAEVKAETVRELAKKWQIPMNQTVAMGDGANDLVMMAAAELGVAFHAKPLVREKADVSVRQGGLDQLLYLL